MYDFLVDHAAKHVWCSPDQDKQFILELAKISSLDGDLNRTLVFNRQITLPILNKRFHIYQIGQLIPALVGLLDTSSVWTSFADACNASNAIIDIYANSGIQMPRHTSWYMITPDKNIIVAIQEQPNININLNVEPIFIRFYNNSYFQSDRSSPLNDYVRVVGRIVSVNTDIVAVQQEINNYNNLPGLVYCFVNGYKVSGINLITTKPGDLIEYVYDSSIYKVVDLPFSNLSAFISTLDNKDKYLLHYADNNDGSIDFYDDIDLFLFKQDINGMHKGVYYHRNAVDAVRMVTHKDYSIPSIYVNGYLNSVAGWVDAAELTVRLHIRKSGYFRPLVFENNRIEELYKLTDDKVILALNGVNATIPNWHAPVLEAAAYATIMRSSYAGITRQLVENAYGYNAISKAIGDSPINTVNTGTPVASVPYGLMKESVAYEYDSNGLLLGWYQHSNASSYIAVNPNTAKVEFISGVADPNFFLDEQYNKQGVVLDPNLEYRFYLCQIVGGLATNQFFDVTGTSAYSIVNGVVTWTVDLTQYCTLIRSNKKILAYDIHLMATDGLLEFTLEHNETRNNVSAMHAMEVPMGELDIFLNRNGLIEGIDYIVKFPKVYIFNKKYLVDVLNSAQTIHVRFTGFCNSDLTRNIDVDKGFIDHGLLSNNNRFDIRDDKVLRIVVDGKLYSRDMLQFAESDSGVSVPNANNGLPYSIRDIVVPLKGIAVSETYSLRAKSRLIDNAIADYMTMYYPNPVINTPNIISSLYPIYSPFICNILNNLKNGTLDDPRLFQQYSDQDIVNICKPYEYLLDFDPAYGPNVLDPNM